MLEQVNSRRISLGLSIRQLAEQLECSPTLVSLVLAGKRQASKSLTRKFQVWLNAPARNLSQRHPATVIRQFIAERRGTLSPGTIRFYEQKLSPFATWCERNGHVDIASLGRLDVSRFLGHVRNGVYRQLSPGALKLHHQALKTLFNYVAETCGVRAEWKNPCSAIKVKPSQAQTLEYSESEIHRMFELVNSLVDDFTRSRNVAILTVLLNTGLRSSELLKMQHQDISANGTVKVMGKGGNQRVVTVGATGLRAIEAHVAVATPTQSTLWNTFDGRRLTQHGLRSMLARIEHADSAAFPDGVYAHRFRHTTVTRLLRAGVPLRSVQRYVGHGSPQTTLRYAQALDVESAIEHANEFVW